MRQEERERERRKEEWKVKPGERVGLGRLPFRWQVEESEREAQKRASTLSRKKRRGENVAEYRLSAGYTER